MSFERIMGIEVINEELYQKYRDNMLPILHTYGGNFGFDFIVSKVLKSTNDDPINRVFTLSFPSKEVMDCFFSDSSYLEVKRKYFEDAVKAVTTISMHEKSL